jgi:dihydrofolate reductase
MGKLIYGMSVSLDGFIDTPSHSLDWALVDDELHSHFNDQAREISASLYGRRMYELMMEYWPTAETDPEAAPAEVEYAGIWKNTPRIVFSRTLTGVDPGSRLVRDDPVEEVTRLKAQPGFDMDVGGASLASTLIRAGLVDEYRISIHPVILGAGTPFFPGLEDRIGLKLVETRTFDSGVVYLRYERRRSARMGARVDR